MKISIVVPLFNECESLTELFAAIDAVLREKQLTYEVLFVDDGSTDGSFDVCTRLHAAHPQQVRVIRFSRNFGKAAALSVGIADATGDVIITMDADLQDDPVAIPGMLKKIDEGWDVVSGWKKKRYDPLSKTVPSKFFNWFTSIVSGVRIHDFNCGFKAYRAQSAKSLEIYGDRHRYLPVLAHWNNNRVTEVEVPHHPRKYGKTKYGWDRLITGAFDLLTLVFLHRYMRRPLHFFGLLGVLFCAVGTVILAYFGVEWIITGAMKIRPLVLLSVGMEIMGIQFVSIGLIGELVANTNNNKDVYVIREKLE